MGEDIEWQRDADPDRDWQRGLAYLVRIRSIAVAGITDTVGFGYIWKKVDLPRAIAFSVALACVVLTLVVIRIALRRTCRTGAKFHAVSHAIRESCQQLRRSESEGIYAVHLARFHSDVAEDIADFFRVLLGQLGIQCAIRLATKLPNVAEGQDPNVYVTVGRSRHVTHARAEQSQPIPASAGVPKYLRSNTNSLGIVLFDATKAQSAKNWYPTKNDTLKDVRGVAIAPINSYEKGQKSMYGMLCITSRKKRLSQTALEPLKGFADMLGFIYSQILDERVFREKGGTHGY